MNLINFKDHFSTQADIYIKYRPQYSDDIFSFLSALCVEHGNAWDCGTGNGQAALGLTKYFDHVIATDPSAQQIEMKFLHPKIDYRIETAEENSIPINSVDLITVANALHWFNLDSFYKEVNRVLKPKGIIAAWCYGIPSISKEIDEIVTHYHDNTLNDYWLPENRLVEKGYSTISFPFEQIESKDFYIEKSMTLYDFVNYLNTWSATQRYIRMNQLNPTEKILQELIPIWGGEKEEKVVSWKLILKVGEKV